jgi:hypothetical protein
MIIPGNGKELFGGIPTKHSEMASFFDKRHSTREVLVITIVNGDWTSPMNGSCRRPHLTEGPSRRRPGVVERKWNPVQKG